MGAHVVEFKESGLRDRATDHTALTTTASEEQELADPKSNTGKSPAFQFYPKDFTSDEEQAVMTLAECGAYMRLLCSCWTNGSIPADIVKLAAIVKTSPAEMRKVWPAVSVKFKPHRTEEGRLVNPRLAFERRKQIEFRKKQGENGKKGGRPNKGLGFSGEANTPVVAKPKESSALSDLHSSSSSADSRPPQERVRAVEPKPTNGTPSHFAQQPSDFSPDEHRRAGNFVERYGDMHEKHRKGARYIGKPNLDYLEALQLVRVWDDARLDKLAHAFLVTDDEWVSSGSRTLARFRSRASWCDDELRKVGL